MKISEDLMCSNYLIIHKRKSAIDPTQTIELEIGLRCPFCKVILNVITHGKNQKCYNCGLKMWRFGNCLYCIKIFKKDKRK